MGANASRHKAMSYGYMNKEIQRLKLRSSNCSSKPSSSTPSKTLLWEAVVAHELPDELKRREERLAKIREAKARLEAEARPRRKTNNAAATRSKPSVKPKAASGGAKNPPRSTPRPRTKRKTNFTDAEAKVMKQSNKGFDYSYNAQAVVDMPNRSSWRRKQRMRRMTSSRPCRWPKRPWTT